MLQLASTPVSQQDGRDFTLTALADITESRRLEQERQSLLEHAREAAEEANRMKDDFLGVVSHELRTPLTAVLGWAHILTEHPSPLRRCSTAVSASYGATPRPSPASSTTSSTSRGSSTGKLRVDVRPMNVEPVVQAVVDSLRPTAEAKGLAMTVLAEAGCRVLGDAERLPQVVWNLVSNAVKFTPSGGSVQVTVGQTPDLVRLVVRDNGLQIRIPNAYSTHNRTCSTNSVCWTMPPMFHHRQRR